MPRRERFSRAAILSADPRKADRDAVAQPAGASVETIVVRCVWPLLAGAAVQDRCRGAGSSPAALSRHCDGEPARCPAGLVERVIEGSSARRRRHPAGRCHRFRRSRRAAGGAPPTSVAAVRPRRAGDRLDVVVSRAGRNLAEAVPPGRSAARNGRRLRYAYEAVVADGDLRRTIVTASSGRRPPAGSPVCRAGIGCYSMANRPSTQDEVYRRLLTCHHPPGLRHACVVEKSGMGGQPRGSLRIRRSAERTSAALWPGLQALAATPYVDARADLRRRPQHRRHRRSAACDSKMPVRGIVAMETVGTTWFEHELINAPPPAEARRHRAGGTAAARCNSSNGACIGC